jgi:hypothetical protein
VFELNQKVKVLRANEDKSRWSAIKYGIVVGLGTSFVQVFDPKANVDRIDFCEWFAIDGPFQRVVAI